MRTVHVTTLIVDDEPVARRTLRRLLAEVPWVASIDEAPDGPAAVRVIDDLRPDIVFLDVELPWLSGLEVLGRVTHRPGVIFTTAYDQYAVAAFERRAVDYLLKPFGRQRLREALSRVRESLGRSATPAERSPRDPEGGERPLRHVYVKDGGAVIPLVLDAVERLEARGDYVGVWAAGRRHLIHQSLRDIERRLDAERFVRIHRSHIVNLDYVASVVSHSNARLRVTMRSGATVVASRARARELRTRLRGP